MSHSWALELRRRVEKNRPPDFLIAVFVMVVLFAIEIYWAIKITDDADRTLRAAFAQAEAHFFWTDGYDGTFFPIFIIGILGSPPIFSLFSDQHAVQSRYAWMVLVLWGVVMTATNMWRAEAIYGGYADSHGATWVSSKHVVETKPWSAATGLIAGCEARKKKASPRNRLTYDVRFGRRLAELAPKRSWIQDMPKWLGKVKVVDAAIPPSTPFTRTAFSWRCVAYHSRDLSLEDDKALVALFRPTADHVRQIMPESAVWGEFVAEVIAEERRKP